MVRKMSPKQKSRCIAGILRQKIRSRKLAPGAPLPSARDLAMQYKVCMMTANRALDILERDSLILRRKGSGNYVQKNIPQSNIRIIMPPQGFLTAFNSMQQLIDKLVEAKVLKKNQKPQK